MTLTDTPEYPEINFWGLETSIHKRRHQKLQKNTQYLDINGILGKQIKARLS